MPVPMVKLKSSVLKRLLTWTRTNISYDMISAATYQPKDNEPWIRPGIFIGRTDHATSKDNGLLEMEGVVYTEIYFPVTWSGGLDIYGVAEEFASLFRRRRDGQIWYREPMIDQVTWQPDDRYHQLQVTVPFIALFRPVPGQLEGLERMHFTQTNSFAKLNVIYHSSTGWALANGGSTNTLGEAVISAVDGDDFVAVHGGFLEIATTYAAGDVLWLSTAADGSMTTVEPTATPKQKVAKVLDTATVLVRFETSST